MNHYQLEATIPDHLHKHRLDQALAALFPQYSRSQLQAWTRAGQVNINHTPALRPRQKIQVGQYITLNADPSVLKYTDENWKAQNIPINIIHEDDTLIIINKAAGLVVHPGAGNPDQTLVNALLHAYPELASVPRAGIIHRLDKGTSGLLIVARNLSAHNLLIQAMQERKVSRQYEAIVQGVMISGGTIEAAIGRHPIHRMRMAVSASGKPAITHYRIIERYRAHTRLRVILETGRTHQIRVHLAHIHYPIVGDSTYSKQLPFSKKVSASLREALAHFNRPALHAKKLSFIHPKTGEPVTWTAPIPDDMQALTEALHNDANLTSH